MGRSPRDGERTVVFSNGKYSGTWAADKMNGRGTFVFAGGGRWVEEEGLSARHLRQLVQFATTCIPLPAVWCVHG